MPKTKKGEKIMAAMAEQYGSEKGREVFYASENKGEEKGAIKGAHRKKVKKAMHRMAGGRMMKDSEMKG